MKKPIPVIDIFAGPGGLGEGFSALGRPENSPSFEIKLSIEKDPVAHRTLELRSFFRKFPHGKAPEEYYEYLRAIDKPENGRKEELYQKFPSQAKKAQDEVKCAELGKEPPEIVHKWITKALGRNKNWVLIGGPPCQAYSLAGRSRNKGNEEYIPEEDHRQYLYKEYLRIIAEHSPAVFVMENVKGLLSATVNNENIFERIRTDLQNPYEALKSDEQYDRKRGKRHKYRLFSLTNDDTDNLHVTDFIVHMENYGIPQARHRVIILGVREDLDEIKPEILKPREFITSSEVLNGLPALRSGLSKEKDSHDAWLSHLQKAPEKRWFKASKNKVNEELLIELQNTVETLRRFKNDRGSEFIPNKPTIEYEGDWFIDDRLEGVCNHSCRGHIVKDLYRYFYSACYAKIMGVSPNLKHFPKDLLPKHKNVDRALKGSCFADRFRVQVESKPSTTITCHISKDGHYYIHPNPVQCRSLTVREAARLQTFPDNYFFCGPRTEQYRQVGNAVPPLLAREIAVIVKNILKRSE